MLRQFLARLFSRPETSHRFAASRVSDSNISQGTDWNGVYRDRYNYQRDTVLKEALLAWRLNPLARRLTTITRQYVVDGIEFHCEHQGTAKFLRELWEHPLNRIGQHLTEWSDELMLTGNLFPLLTTDSAGMTYVRVYPTDQVDKINSAINDVQQELSYTPKPTVEDATPATIANYFASQRKSVRFPKTVMLHYAINKLAGMQWGEPDIAPLLPWLARYASWMEDRVRLNRFRQAYLYIVKGKFLSQPDRIARQNELNASPPSPGSILVTDESEEWDVINPKLDSFEANNDGLTLKKFIAGGHGVPLHWLSEPESSTRTTAEAAGTPTFKTLEERQQFFLVIVQDVLKVAVARRAQRGATDVDPTAAISVTAADISERDNAALALASTQVVMSFAQLWASNLITADEYLRLVYRFAGEQLPGDRPDNPKPTAFPSGSAHAPNAGISIDTKTGEVQTP